MNFYNWSLQIMHLLTILFHKQLHNRKYEIYNLQPVKLIIIVVVGW